MMAQAPPFLHLKHLASNSVQVTFSSHNINGFDRNKSFINSLCDLKTYSIRALQEHWLKPPYKKYFGVNKLRTAHSDYEGFGSSAMRSKMAGQILRGRPYGGTGFVYHKYFSECISACVNYVHDRVTAMELNEADGSILLINAYFPYYNPGKLEEHLELFRETLGFIEKIIADNPLHRIIIFADFNCNLYSKDNCYAKVLKEFSLMYDLIPCFDLMANFDKDKSWTRKDPKTGSYTLLDGILLSKSLSEKVEKVWIGDYADNLSDHVPVEIIMSLVLNTTDIHVKRNHTSVVWSKLSPADRGYYAYEMEQYLDKIIVPFDCILHGSYCCFDDTHKFELEKYYDGIMCAIKHADSFLPRTNVNLRKPYWNATLTDLKEKSVEYDMLWKQNGRPTSGPIFDLRKDSHYKYKIEVRRQQGNSKKLCSDLLYDNLANKDMDGFWKKWRKINSVNVDPVTRIDGACNENDIAKTFSDTYCKSFQPKSGNVERSLKSEFELKFAEYLATYASDDISKDYLSWSDMIVIVDKLKEGKSYAGFVRVEHILKGTPQLIVHLHLLLNGLIQHGFAVTDFLQSCISPIIKDNEGDVTDSANYRPITLGVIFAQMFESALRLQFGHFLCSDDLQFGFKPGHSTSQAVFTVKTCIDYFTKKGSGVYFTCMDFSKAFDSISHYGLFLKLIEKKVPLCFLLIIVFWYLNMSYQSKWGEAKSDFFKVFSGSKQGGILSPDFFSIYIDELITRLRKKGIGCFISLLFVACILFADDLALLAPSRKAMQEMIDVCVDFCNSHCLNFNPKKTKVLVFGKIFKTKDQLAPLRILNTDIEFVDRWRYLGFFINSGKEFSFSAEHDLCSFYRASNTILNVLNKPSEEVQMKLLYTNCVPILSYGCQVKYFSSREMSQCHCALNNAIRKIFSFRRQESIRELRELFGHRDLYSIFYEAQQRFYKSLRSSRNHVLNALSYVVSF